MLFVHWFSGVISHSTARPHDIPEADLGSTAFDHANVLPNILFAASKYTSVPKWLIASSEKTRVTVFDAG